MTGIVVDTMWTGGTVTVKDPQDRETWTVTIDPDTRFYGANGETIDMRAVGIGARVQVRGDSRIPLIVEAAEVDVQEDPFRKTKDLEPLPR